MIVKFTCADCASRVYVPALSPPDGPDLCASCDWIRRNLAEEHHAAARERLGVPLRDPS